MSANEPDRSVTERSVLRHQLSVIAYRGGKFMRGAPPEFARHDTGGGHTPMAILDHLGDLIEWALSHARGEGKWVSRTSADWEAGVARFHATLQEFDAYLAAAEPIRAETTRLIQGPLDDALTHIGQLAMLRRMTGSPVYGENYFVANIEVGRLGPDQAPPARPF